MKDRLGKEQAAVMSRRSVLQLLSGLFMMACLTGISMALGLTTVRGLLIGIIIIAPLILAVVWFNRQFEE